jgi:hypothetical protein
MNKKLFIIGNGFDRFHGIPSSYSHFREFLEESGDNHFLNGISKFIESDDLWSNFEEALGCLNEDQLREEHIDLFERYGDDEWRDSANHDYQFNIEEDLKFSMEIPYYFTEWINSVDIDVERVLRKKYINNDNLYLTFNYTNVLESVYNIKTQNILYIHGKANRGDKLITGHSNKDFTIYKKPVFNSPEEEDEYYGEQDFREQQANDIIKNYFKRTYKNVKAIIEHNESYFKQFKGIQKVYVLGHSISEIDIPYFKEVKKYVDTNCKWYVSYYTENEISVMRNNLNGLGITNIQFIELNQLKRNKYK